MDAFSISYTSPSHRNSSRIYQDLAGSLLHSHNCGVDRMASAMDSPKKHFTKTTMKPPSVCVIGAGISGLRCADILTQHGIKVTLLEARDRVGGRMHQITLPSGHLVDLGPNWIHGTDHNPILDLAKQTRTATHSWDEDVHIFGENGKLLDDGKELSEVMWGVIVQAFKHSAENCTSIDPDESLYDFFTLKVKETFPDEDDISKRRRKTILQMSEFWGAFVGSPVKKQSLKFFWLEECIDGENLFCAGTYQNILTVISRPALQNADVKFSTKVSQITTDDDGVKIHTDAGDELKFDAAVVTMPLGWLKNNKNAFIPPLPVQLSRSIDAIGYGSLEKVYISFPKPFWNLKKGDTGESFTGFSQWLCPGYSTDTNPQRWNQEVVDLSSLPGPSAHPTLLFYIFGEQSQIFATELAALKTQADKEEHINKFFMPYYSLLPNFNPELTECQPVSCLATSWVKDELAGYGSYSTFRTGLHEGDKDIEIMREGLPQRALWFAGEHTAPFVALGTVTGAYWSGEAVAKRIASMYGMACPRGEVTSNIDDILNVDHEKEVNIRGFADQALEK